MARCYCPTAASTTAHSWPTLDPGCRVSKSNPAGQVYALNVLIELPVGAPQGADVSSGAGAAAAGTGTGTAPGEQRPTTVVLVKKFMGSRTARNPFTGLMQQYPPGSSIRLKARLKAVDPGGPGSRAHSPCTLPQPVVWHPQQWPHRLGHAPTCKACGTRPAPRHWGLHH